MRKVIAVVILYHPDKNVIKNILTYSSKADALIIIDNTETRANIDFEALDKKILIADGTNDGIAKRLNQAAQIAIEMGAEWLLTMDQDSYFNDEDLENYFKCVSNDNNKNNIAMYGVEYTKKQNTNSCKFIETDMLITSGSLVNLTLFKNIGGFEEKLFIDEVDSEYCFRANGMGYKTVMAENIYLNHSLGNTTMHRSLKTLKATPRSLHNPIRVYYMIRNFLWIQKKYKGNLPASMPYRKKALLNRLKNNLLYGKKRLQLIKMIYKAFNDYRHNKMGKIN